MQGKNSLLTLALFKGIIVMTQWPTKTLGDLCQFENGDRGKNYPGRKAFVEKGVPFINAGHISDGEIDMSQMNFIPREKFDLISKGKVRKGDVLFCLRGSLGKYGILNENMEGAIASSLVILRPNDFLDVNFLGFYLASPLCKKMIDDYRDGAAQPNLSAKNLKAFGIPLPPLPEQKRIVAILDEAFAAIDKAMASTEKNLANAGELFQSYLDNVFLEKGNEWIDSTLGQVVSFQGGSQPPKSTFTKEPKDGYIRLIQIRDYKTDKHIVYIPRDKAKRFCDSDDVMIGRYGPPLFQILRGIEGAYNVALMKAAPHEDRITKDYLYYFLRNGEILRYIIRSSNRAAGQIGLNKATIEPYPIAFPPKEKQAEAVLRFQEVEQKTRQLQSAYQSKINALKEMKQAVLNEAFSGRLTDNFTDNMESVTCE